MNAYETVLTVDGAVEVSNLTPDGPANTLFGQYRDVGQWYKVETIGDTSSGVFSTECCSRGL